MEKQEGRDPAAARIDDPWYDALASGWGELDGGSAPATVPAQQGTDAGERLSPAEIYLEVHRSAAFQEVRRRYRRFVVPAGIAFFAWYLAYVITAVSAPGFMARPVAGAVNVAMVAGLAQFLSTFLLTWAYARHARLRRDRAALELRWVVFEQNQQNLNQQNVNHQHQQSGNQQAQSRQLRSRQDPPPANENGRTAPPTPGVNGSLPGQGDQHGRRAEPGRGARRNDGQGTTRGAHT
ncbi:DUF485 domain-containing protein [Streptomyces sp. NPDC006691]|uniref:DUF485 domain-containing protein n=1 Tax=Streptomyces sp. NPDC006691 TaxID=3364757 RepID=UPI0036B44EC8